MDQDRVTDTAKNIGGKTKQDFGRIARDAQAQVKEAAGAAEDLYGQARDAAASFTDIVQRTIEQQPYTAVAVAAVVGWLMGRAHRPI